MCARRKLLAWAAAVLLVTGARSLTVAQEPSPAPLVALISELSGTATIRSPSGGPPVAAKRFDALSSGMSMEMGPTSRAVVILSNGDRFEFGANARATFTATGLASSSGPIETLPRLPALPKLASLDESGPKGPPGSVRVRGERIPGLRPFGTVMLGARSLTLSFTPVSGASRYLVEVENADAQRIARGETTRPEFVVPAGVLAPGGKYYWTVQTLDKVGGAARGAGQFKILSSEDARARAALHASLTSPSSESVALLAEIDRRLGLYAEALAGFRAALAGAPRDPAILQAIHSIEELQGR